LGVIAFLWETPQSLDNILSLIGTCVNENNPKEVR